MGNRGSISVFGKDEESVVLFRHWEGDEEGMIKLVEKALKWKQPNTDYPDTGIEIFKKGEPSEIIALLTCISVNEIGSSAYLGKSESDGDNSDNGHFQLIVADGKITLFHNAKIVKEWKLGD